MKRRNFVAVIVLMLIAATGTACARQIGADGEPGAADGGEVEDYVSLVDALRAGGAEVEASNEIEQEFFDVTGQIITVNGEDVQVFEYDSTEAAREQADLIDPSGSPIGTSMMMWVDTPHFYQKGRLIVLYVGNTDTVLSLLEASLGDQIAGG